MSGTGGGMGGFSTRISEWEARELLRGTALEASKRSGISLRSVYRYRARRYTCVHCGVWFMTWPAAWDHMFGRDVVAEPGLEPGIFGL